MFSGLFGVLKFHDIFSTDSDKGSMANQNDKQPADKSNSQQENQNNEKESELPVQEPEIDQKLADEIGSYSWVVNKTRPLQPKEYIPPTLVFPTVKLRVPGNESMKIRFDVANSVQDLFSAAQAEGFSPMFSSGYRSYGYQVNLYGSYVKSQGQLEADKQSARPGYSEHQTGLAFDICNAGDCRLEQEFESTPLGQWIANNAHKYGFTVRYRKDKDQITGYMYEPWHLRYVGIETATKLYEKNLTLEEYFNLPAAPTY